MFVYCFSPCVFYFMIPTAASTGEKTWLNIFFLTEWSQTLEISHGHVDICKTYWKHLLHFMSSETGLTLTDFQARSSCSPSALHAFQYNCCPLTCTIILMGLLLFFLKVVREGAWHQHEGLWRVLTHLLKLVFIKTHLPLQKLRQDASCQRKKMTLYEHKQPFSNHATTSDGQTLPLHYHYHFQQESRI